MGKLTSAVPNPGSDEAVNLGCWCPVLDNRRGAGVPSSSGVNFWISSGCPIHAPITPAGLAALQPTPKPEGAQ